MRQASNMQARERTADDVIKHLLDFAGDVFDNIGATRQFNNERLRQRAGSIIDAYEPEYSLRTTGRLPA